VPVARCGSVAVRPLRHPPRVRFDPGAAPFGVDTGGWRSTVRGEPGHVVVDLVVVERRHPRCRSMQRLEVGIAAVLGVATVVVVEGAALVGRVVGAALAAPTVFVDVVAQVHDQVEIPVDQRPVPGELAARPPCAAGDAQPDRGRPGGECPATTDRRPGPLTAVDRVRAEPVTVGGARSQTVDLGAHHTSIVRSDDADRLNGAVVVGEGPGHRLGLAVDTRPQHERGRRRIATRHTADESTITDHGRPRARPAGARNRRTTLPLSRCDEPNTPHAVASLITTGLRHSAMSEPPDMWSPRSSQAGVSDVCAGGGSLRAGRSRRVRRWPPWRAASRRSST
jgi:hypothetical protein